MSDAMNAFFRYLVVLNVIAAILFIYDKVAAAKRKRRIPENLLHFFELAGGVFFVVPLIFLIRHKICKFSYYRITYLLMIVWTLVIWLVFF